MPRSPRKRDGRAAKRGTSKEQMPVLVVRDRHGETADFIPRDTSTHQIKPTLMPLLSKDVFLCNDGMSMYKQIARHAKIVHRPVNVVADCRVKSNIYHIQNVNTYDSRPKQWMAKFHRVDHIILEITSGGIEFLIASVKVSRQLSVFYRPL